MKTTNKTSAIITELTKDIQQGKLVDKLPSEKDLAARFNIAPMTAARVLNALRDKGLVQRIPGLGTFVRSVEVTELRIWKTGYFAMKHLAALEKLVPHVRLTTTNDFDSADLAVFSTTVAVNYSPNFLPWPEKLIEDLKSSGRFFSHVFEFHHIGTPTYAVPYTFSPELLLYNKSLMQKFCPDFHPYRFTFENFIALAQAHPDQFIDTQQSINGLLLDLSYARGGLDKAVDDFRKLPEIKTNTGRSFAQGDYLFRTILRGNLSKFSNLERFELMPIPSINGQYYCHSASEAMMVKSNCLYPELAFEVAVATLSPEFQQLVSQEKCHIPADQQKAVMTIDSRFIRDDLFFNEIKNIHYPREIIDPISTAVIMCGLKRLINGEFDLASFLQLVKEEKMVSERHQMALKYLLFDENNKSVS